MTTRQSSFHCRRSASAERTDRQPSLRHAARSGLSREGFVGSRIVESPEGPPRKYYELTKAGQQQLEQINRYWNQIGEGIARLVKEKQS